MTSGTEQKASVQKFLYQVPCMQTVHGKYAEDFSLYALNMHLLFYESALVYVEPSTMHVCQRAPYQLAVTVVHVERLQVGARAHGPGARMFQCVYRSNRHLN